MTLGRPPNKEFLVGFLVVVLVIHAVAIWKSAYYYLWWLDLGLHFLGGFWLGAFAFFVLQEQNPAFLSAGGLLFFVVVLGFIALGGVSWEIVEYGYDLVIGRKPGGMIAQLGVDDIMTDLISDLAGGLAAYRIFRRKSS